MTKKNESFFKKRRRLRANEEAHHALIEAMFEYYNLNAQWTRRRTFTDLKQLKSWLVLMHNLIEIRYKSLIEWEKAVRVQESEEKDQRELSEETKEKLLSQLKNAANKMNEEFNDLCDIESEFSYTDYDQFIADIEAKKKQEEEDKLKEELYRRTRPGK